MSVKITRKQVEEAAAAREKAPAEAPDFRRFVEKQMEVVEEEKKNGKEAN